MVMPSSGPRVGIPAAEWAKIFEMAKVETDRLTAARSAHSRSTIMGNFLARFIGREVRIEVNGRTGTATLKLAPGRANQKRYYFEISWDDQQALPEGPAGMEPLHSPDGQSENGEQRGNQQRKKSACKVAKTCSTSPAVRVTPATNGTGNGEAW